MRENICKQCDWQGINFQTIQIAHHSEWSKTKIWYHLYVESRKKMIQMKLTHLQNRHRKQTMVIEGERRGRHKLVTCY